MITILIYLKELPGILAYYNYLLYGLNFGALTGENIEVFTNSQNMTK